jgi:hypothetical protein
MGLPAYAVDSDGKPDPRQPLVWHDVPSRGHRRRAVSDNRGWNRRAVKATRVMPVDEHGQVPVPPRPRSPRSVANAVKKATRPLRRTRAQRLAQLRELLPGATRGHLKQVDREMRRQRAAAAR